MTFFQLIERAFLNGTMIRNGGLKSFIYAISEM